MALEEPRQQTARPQCPAGHTSDHQVGAELGYWLLDLAVPYLHTSTHFLSQFTLVPGFSFSTESHLPLLVQGGQLPISSPLLLQEFPYLFFLENREVSKTHRNIRASLIPSPAAKLPLGPLHPGTSQ